MNRNSPFLHLKCSKCNYKTINYKVVVFSSRRNCSFPPVQSCKGQNNTPFTNASDLIDGIDEYNPCEAGGKKPIRIFLFHFNLQRCTESF